MGIALLSLLAVRNCDCCAHFQEGFCSFPKAAITGYIARPAEVVCVKWVKVDEEKP